jgi:hypothetical protein
MRLVIAILCLLCSLARAETRRVAVVVGNNAGSGEQVPLRYAEVDAGKVGRVLVELGGVAPENLFLLQGQGLAALDATLKKAAAKVAEYQKNGLDRVVLLFYYSGHSDGVALELGRDRFSFGALRTWLAATGAEVRVGLIDSCKSGALIASKGGSAGPAFQIRLTDDLSSSGEALLTSSAANEDALESREIGGSFFTHHLVSGLRGAADASGDSRVTLTEAYQYAYKHTISTSGATLAGPQHPAYDFRLSGQGELGLTELSPQSAALALPEGFDRALVIEVARDQVIAELGPGTPAHIAVMPGRYGVRMWKGTQAYEGKVTVAANAVRGVRWDEVSKVTLPAPQAKGDLVAAAPSPSLPFAVSGGISVRGGIAEELDILGGARVGLRSLKSRGKAVELDVVTAGNGIVRETSVFLFGVYRVGVGGGRLRGWAGAEAGVGAVFQSSTSSASSGALAASPTLGVSLGVSRSVALALELQVPATLLVKDGDVAVVFAPGLVFGAVIRP